MINIEVKDEHINHGERSFCDSCAIALALLDVFPRAKKIEVQDADYIRIDGKKHSVASDDFERVTNFIYNFDTGRLVSPMDFKLVGEA